MSKAKTISFDADSRRYAWLHPWFPAPIMLKFLGHPFIFRSAAQLYAIMHVEEKSDSAKKIARHYDPERWMYFSSKKGAGDDFVILDRNQEIHNMTVANRYKFTHNPILARQLMSTMGSDLSYNAPWDDVFGVGKDGKGEDQLGRILMDIRDTLVRKPELVRTYEFAAPKRRK